MPEKQHLTSVEFLKLFRPKGIHILSAVASQKNGMPTRSFVDDDERMAAWIDDNRGANVYFSVNPVIRPINKKAERENIAALEYLHVDLDPPKGTTPETFEAERAKLLALLTTDLPESIPPPTWVIDSGSGYWGLWKLNSPMEIDGQASLYEEAKRYNIQLEILFGADACHNVDRIARLPGTVNYPNKKKVEIRGPEPRDTCIVEYNPDNLYELSSFTQAPLLQLGGELGFSGGTVEVSGNVQYADDIDAALSDFPQVSEKCKVVIVQGNDPDDPSKWGSRSEPLFWVTCELVRADVDNDTIFMIITNPAWGISESVIAKGRRFEKYAIRQIEQARENAIDPHLRELNTRHAVISNIDGKCRVLSEVQDGTGRACITYPTFEDIRNRYMNRKVVMAIEDGDDKKIREVPLGKWWLEHPNRRQFEGVVFAPGGEPSGYYNLWRGFVCDARPGNCDLYLAHLRDNICCGDPKVYEYLINWMASAVQKPQEPGHVAIVLQSKGQGTGKGEAIKKFGNLFGRHFVQVTDAKHLVGQFNAHLEDCVVLFADEAFSVGVKQHESVLKTLITEDRMMAESKGVNVKQSANYLHLMMASNEDWVIPAGPDDRRFLMLKVSEDKKQNHTYFKAIDREYRAGGQEALLHFLMNHDISQFDPRVVPTTAAMAEQKQYSMPVEAQWWMHKLDAGCISEGDNWPREVRCLEATEDFATFAQRARERVTPVLGKFLRQLYESQVVKRRGHYKSEKGEDIKQARFWTVPELDEAREEFCKVYLGGAEYDWSKTLDMTTVTEDDAY